MRYTLTRFDTPDEDGHLFHFIAVRDGAGWRASDAAFAEVLAWTRAEFGEGPSVNGLRQAIGTRWCYKLSAWTLWMRDEADAFRFKLRWC